MYKFRLKIDDLVGKRHQESSMCCHPADSFGTWCCTGCAWCGRPWIHWSFYVTLASVPLKNGKRRAIIKKTPFKALPAGRTALHFASTKQTARALLRALADVTWLGDECCRVVSENDCDHRKRLSTLNCSWCPTSLSGHDFKLVLYLKLHLSLVSSLRCDIRIVFIFNLGWLKKFSGHLHPSLPAGSWQDWKPGKPRHIPWSQGNIFMCRGECSWFPWTTTLAPSRG